MKTLKTVNTNFLEEIGKIGANYASDSLSELTGLHVHMQVPYAKVFKLEDMNVLIENSDQVDVGLLSLISEGLDGYVLLTFNENDANTFKEILRKTSDIPEEKILNEAANIISGSFISAISSLMRISIDMAYPDSAKDMFKVLLNAAFSNLYWSAEEVLTVNIRILIENKYFSGTFIFMLEKHSMRKITRFFAKRLLI